MPHPTPTPLPESHLGPDGRPWWKPRNRPGTNQVMGGAHRAAAFLWFEKKVGDTFSMREIREALGEDRPDSAEHLNRRLRDLRRQGWRFDSYKDREGQASDVYLLVEKGAQTWLGEQRADGVVSATVRRQVFGRDSNRCVICGVGACEPYPEIPDSRARMTIGHRTAGARTTDASVDNLQTECSRCNEPAGDNLPDPEQVDAVQVAVKRLPVADRRMLLTLLELGYRQRLPVDLAFDRVRRLSASERENVLQSLCDSLISQRR